MLSHNLTEFLPSFSCYACQKGVCAVAVFMVPFLLTAIKLPFSTLAIELCDYNG